MGPDQKVWGLPEDIYRTLKKGYDSMGIPITNWEPDNSLAANFHTPSGWIYKDWTKWNLTLYPSGGNLSKLLGGIPLTLYYNGFDANDNVPSKTWKFRNGEIDPGLSYKFHFAMIKNAVDNWNMQALFTDFLNFRGGDMSRDRGNYGNDEPEHLWLGGQAQAAQDLGCEVRLRWCSVHCLVPCAWVARCAWVVRCACVVRCAWVVRCARVVRCTWAWVARCARVCARGHGWLDVRRYGWLDVRVWGGMGG